jgi:hypothetical protein
MEANALSDQVRSLIIAPSEDRDHLHFDRVARIWRRHAGPFGLVPAERVELQGAERRSA